METRGHEIITIGASLGGIEAISRLLAQLPANLPAALFVVQHISASGPGILAKILGRHSALPVSDAKDGERIEPGRVYVAARDHHMLLGPGHIHVVRGPRENRFRPAIDPLFRSAAAVYRSHVIGVILTGYLDDGVDGLLAIKRCGGIAIVQEPSDAQIPDMPQNALARVTVDRVVCLDALCSLLVQLAHDDAPEPPEVPADLQREFEMMNAASGITSPDGGQMAVWGRPTRFACPECGGALQEVAGNEPPRYRCRVGHGYTQACLLEDQSDAIDRSLWGAIRALEERGELLSQMAAHSRQSGFEAIASAYEKQQKESTVHAKVLRSMVESPF